MGFCTLWATDEHTSPLIGNRKRAERRYQEGSQALRTSKRRSGEWSLLTATAPGQLRPRMRRVGVCLRALAAAKHRLWDGRRLYGARSTRLRNEETAWTLVIRPNLGLLTKRAELSRTGGIELGQGINTSLMILTNILGYGVDFLRKGNIPKPDAGSL